jgi:hypothetical protein
LGAAKPGRGADNDYRLDWTGRPDSGRIPLAGLGISDWGERNAAALVEGGSERINHNRRRGRPVPIPFPSISSVSSLLASLSARIASPLSLSLRERYT